MKNVFDLYGHSLGTVGQKEQRILRAQNTQPIENKSAPGLTRTGDLRIRNPSLYPPELQGQLNDFLYLLPSCFPCQPPLSLKLSSHDPPFRRPSACVLPSGGSTALSF